MTHLKAVGAVFSEVSTDQPIALGRDDGRTASLLHILANEISVIVLVGKQHLGVSLSH